MVGHILISKDQIKKKNVLNFTPLINKYNWGVIKYPLKIDDWKTSDRNNLTISLDVLNIKEVKICPAYL